MKLCTFMIYGRSCNCYWYTIINF